MPNSNPNTQIASRDENDDFRTLRKQTQDGTLLIPTAGLKFVTDLGDVSGTTRATIDTSGNFSGGLASVVTYGADPTGVGDSTNAIIAALEAANGIAAGTWLSGGDPYNGPDVSRQRIPVFFPPGKYKTTSTIPIRFRGVAIVGADTASQGDGPYEGWLCSIDAQHDSPIFELDTTYNTFYFSIKNLRMFKTGSHIGLGHGVSVVGPNYNWGPRLDGVMIRACEDGVHYEPQGVVDGTGSGAQFVVSRCSIDDNAGWGIYYAGHAGAGSRIVDNSIVQNTIGGIRIGGKGLVIESNDLEGQPRPCEVAAGSNSNGVAVRGNYFEAIDASTTEACIVTGTCHGFDIRGNTYSSGVAVPHVSCRDSSRGTVDEDAQQQDCSDVVNHGRLVIPAAGTANKALSLAWNAGGLALPLSNIPASVALAGTPGGVLAIGTREVAADPVETPNYRVLLSGGPASWANGSYLAWAVAIQYPGDLPHGAVLTQVLGTISAVESVVASSAVQPPGDCVRVGDTLVYFFMAKNTTGSTITSTRFYVSPYGSDTTPGLGALVTQVAGWIVSDVSNGIPFANALDLVS